MGIFLRSCIEFEETHQMLRLEGYVGLTYVVSRGLLDLGHLILLAALSRLLDV